MNIYSKLNQNNNNFSPRILKRIKHFEEWIKIIIEQPLSTHKFRTNNKLGKYLRIYRKSIRSRESRTRENIDIFMKENIDIHGIHEILDMFKEIQIPFEKYTEYRRSFFSYQYVLLKFIQILDLKNLSIYYDEILPLNRDVISILMTFVDTEIIMYNYSHMKSKTKLYEQDLIFEKICDDLGWRFIPSI
jgi:hypothetical protein